ncbi:hypothetical protein AB0J80_25030 [Actinoplanes sp. NPDC049548]|uniref:hypothetical protein n=1 Tax=Actinoplanes sp. NPDC049548 TaxID=3155152 RepID=UPI0034201BCB
MSRLKLILGVLGGLGVLVVVGGLAVAALAGPDSAAPRTMVAGAPRPSDSTWPLNAPPLAPSAPAGTSMSPAAPAATGAAGAGTPEAPRDGGAAPFVQDFARQPGVKPLPRKPSPKAKLSMPAFADGCDHAYGDRNQCIPLVFPPGTTDKCAWLAEHGFKDVAVVGRDRQRLDPDGDRIACNS